MIFKMKNLFEIINFEKSKILNKSLLILLNFNKETFDNKIIV